MFNRAKDAALPTFMATTSTQPHRPRRSTSSPMLNLGTSSSDGDREKEQRIIAFLDMVAQDAQELFIVGDLFDYWFEYRSVYRGATSGCWESLQRLPMPGSASPTLPGTMTSGCGDTCAKSSE